MRGSCARSRISRTGRGSASNSHRISALPQEERQSGRIYQADSTVKGWSAAKRRFKRRRAPLRRRFRTAGASSRRLQCRVPHHEPQRYPIRVDSASPQVDILYSCFELGPGPNHSHSSAGSERPTGSVTECHPSIPSPSTICETGRLNFVARFRAVYILSDTEASM